MNRKLYGLQFTPIIFSAILLGFAFRMLILLRGHNYDFDSFVIVTKNLDQGLNVYTSTTRYNYGPIWFIWLHFLYIIASKDLDVFRLFLVLFLSSVDFAIFYVLFRRVGCLVACLFFLNPISIIITGYHNQFDNLAILLGMLSVLMIGDDFDQSVNPRKLLGLILLGLSLMTKHLFFMFPFWLAIKQEGFSQKVLVIFVPVFIFLLGFAPYWGSGSQGIIRNVFLYISGNNPYFYKLFIPDFFKFFYTSSAVWLMLLVYFAIYFRHKNGFDSLLFYTCILVAASPALTNQYLAIVVPFISAYSNPFFLAYTIVSTLYLSVDFDGPHFLCWQGYLNKDAFYSALVVLLCLGFAYTIWGNKIHDFFQWILREFRIQIGYYD